MKSVEKLTAEYQALLKEGLIPQEVFNRLIEGLKITRTSPLDSFVSQYHKDGNLPIKSLLEIIYFAIQKLYPDVEEGKLNINWEEYNFDQHAMFSLIGKLVTWKERNIKGNIDLMVNELNQDETDTSFIDAIPSVKDIPALESIEEGKDKKKEKVKTV